jgi:hypothetical protein
VPYAEFPGGVRPGIYFPVQESAGHEDTIN